MTKLFKYDRDPNTLPYTQYTKSIISNLTSFCDILKTDRAVTDTTVPNKLGKGVRFGTRENRVSKI